jgi:5-methyltetrahydrofolate--homocysteine methyltransferase
MPRQPCEDINKLGLTRWRPATATPSQATLGCIMKNSRAVLDFLCNQIVLMDGAMGTQLIAMGLELGEPPDKWNLDHPDRVVEVHRGYLAAGCDIIQTNTFGANPIKLSQSGLAGTCPEINAKAVELARTAARSATMRETVFVAGNVGPTGLFLPPVGAATDDQLRSAFAEQIEALASSGADLISIETMYDLREARAAVQAASRTGLPIFASMTFAAKPRGFFTIMGDRIGPSLKALGDAGAHVVGFNCTVTGHEMIPMVVEAKQETGLLVIAQPNAGPPLTTDSGVRYDADPETFARDLVEMVQAGARVVGGCCGTDPEFIRAARIALDGISSTDQK